MPPGGVDDIGKDRVAGLTRRGMMFGLPLTLAACTTMPAPQPSEAELMYGAVTTEPFPVPAVDLSYIDPRYYRRVVPKFLFLVLADNMAIQYGVGVGRDGFEWAGRAYVGRKAEWPTWTPPYSMLLRDPLARPWAGGMPGGPDNPLGARALYLYHTLYRIHGTNQPWSIGQAMSSGCIRMMNQDILHLYELVPVGTNVTVLTA
jgi:lipoprotein-anchoring transpeptidase ErfK/SrfK